VKASKGWNTELPGVLLELRNPLARLSRTETKGTVFSCLGETLWYLAKSKELDFIEYYLSGYEKFSDDKKTVHGAYTLRRAERLLAGKEAITKDVAKLLSGHLGGSERFWMSREGNYRSEVARLQSIGNQSAAKAWLDELPIRDMQKFGWIPRNETVGANVEACLHFFDVANVSEWRAKYQNVLSAVSFRTSPTYKSEPGAVLAWLRYGEVRARRSACRTWDSNLCFRRLAWDCRRAPR
jgi:hypothetical protein